MWQVEVRTPTYRRYDLLERALTSLIYQTYPHWRCIVLDDEPGGGLARDVCAKLNEPRIIYRPNRKNLGVGPNIDAAFSIVPSEGVTHACVLEDDNYYLPDFLAANLAVMTEYDVDIVLRNQLVEVPGAQRQSVRRSVYDGQYVEGVADQDELWATFFFSTGANNSSLFWRLGKGISFSTAKMTSDPVFQERLRTLCIDRAVYIAMDAKVVWRDNGRESTRPRLRGLPWYLAQIRAACRERDLYCQLYEHLCERGLARKVWQNRFRAIDARCEKVFRRVGVTPPIASRCSVRERAILSIKREAVRMVGMVVAEPYQYRLGDSRVEEAAHPRRFGRPHSRNAFGRT